MMQVYALRLHNFFRFSEKNNSVVFDILPEDRVLLDKGETTIDKIYDRLLENPVEYINKVKNNGLTNLIGIAGVIDGNYDLSNGAGKSTVLEAICYAHYEQIVRRNANTDKIATAGLSVVTKINGKYPPKMKESWVEEIFEEGGKIYRIKRGRSFTSTQQNSSPILEFVCYNGGEEDSQAGHRKADTNESIAKVTPMDYDLFVNSVLFGQADQGKFLNSPDSVRKDMLINLLKLEDVINGCLENIRKRKNAKDKEITAINTQIDILDNNLKTKESVEAIEEKIKALRNDISTIENGIKEHNLKIEELSKSKSIKILEDIKTDGKKVKDNLNAQKEAKESQIKEWNNLSLDIDKKIKSENDAIQTIIKDRNEAKNSQVKEWTNLALETDRKIKTQESKIQTLVEKQKEIQNQISKLEVETKRFDLATREETLKKVDKAREWKPKLIESLASSQIEKEKIIADIASNTSESNRVTKEINSLETQLKNVTGDEFVCDKCRSKVGRKHIEDEIQKNKVIALGCKSNIDKLVMEQKEKIEKLAKVQSNLDKANELLIAENKVKAEIQDNNSKIQKLEDAKKLQSEDYSKTLEDIKGDILSLNKQKLEYTNKSNEVATRHDLETNKMISNKKVELESLNKQKLEYAQKSNEIASKYDTEINKMQTQLNELAAKYTNAKKDAEDIENVIKGLRDGNDKAVTNKSQLDSQIGSLKKDIENIAKETEKLVQLKGKSINELAILNRLQVLDTIFGLEGVQTRIIKKYLPLLNNYIKEMLDVLSNGEINVVVYINDKSKVDIAILGGSSDSYVQLSGGEKTLIRLSISVGLSLLSLVRSASKPELICLDEIFSALDVAHEETAFKLLKKLQEKFSRILLISHRASINDRIEHKILVEKDSGIYGMSKIRSIM